jgi:hypothetical protein
MRDLKDRSCSWLLDKHPGAVLFVAGERQIRACRSVRNILTAPKKVPDGLLEVEFAGSSEPEDFLVEVATYPDSRILDQIVDDLCMVKLVRGRVPEVVVLVLLPRGNQEFPTQGSVKSRRGRTSLGGTWHVAPLGTVSAATLLASGDVGAVPLVPLTQLGAPAEVVLQQCKDLIEQKAAPEEQANLLAITQVLTEARFPNAALLALLGGKKLMIESPMVQELLEERTQQTFHENILRVLEKRLGPVPAEVSAAVRVTVDKAALERLLDLAASCPDLITFRTHLRL